MHNSCKKNWKLDTKQMENTSWLMWLLARMRSQTKINYNFAMHNEYLISVKELGPRFLQYLWKYIRPENVSGTKQNLSRI